MAVCRVVGPAATATVDPARGGKILSLTGPDGREWLAQSGDPAHPPYRGDIAFTDSDPAGWDECAPSIDPCEIAGRAIPDHGDLWTAEWSVRSARVDSLRMSVTGRSLGYRLSRSIVATANGFRFDYRASAIRRAIPFLWAAHPQFVSPRGSALELAGVVTVIDVLDAAQPRMSWSKELATVDSLPDGGCRKLYVNPGTQVDAATLRHPDGAALTMSWQNCPYLGLWFDHGAFSRQPVVAIEPSLGFRDSLSWAVKHGRSATLIPGRDLQWSLSIEMSSAI